MKNILKKRFSSYNLCLTSILQKPCIIKYLPDVFLADIIIKNKS